MLKVVFIVRSTFYEIHGGSGVQVTETARHLRKSGVSVDIKLTHEKINYNNYDLLHFFDIIRPSNILYHTRRTKTPFVISPVLVDYAEYDKNYRKGVAGLLFRFLPAGTNEYLKAVARWLSGKDSLQDKFYLWKGHNRSVREVLSNAAMVLPNSQAENNQLLKVYGIKKPFVIVPNGINTELFRNESSGHKDPALVICAARIEGIKNQVNLISALNDTEFKLLIVGEASANQSAYYNHCRQLAAPNIRFTGKIPQAELVSYYKQAKVHVLPSWFETCGLSSLEAAAMECNIVITDKGYTRDYFGDDAFYCDPGIPESILETIRKAASAPVNTTLKNKIFQNYTWQHAAERTLEAYKMMNPSLTL